MTPLPAHLEADPVQVGLLDFEAIVFAVQYLANLFQQALRLREIGEGHHRPKDMNKPTVFSPKNQLSSGLQPIYCRAACTGAQLISADKLASQNIRRCVSSYPAMNRRAPIRTS